MGRGADRRGQAHNNADSAGGVYHWGKQTGYSIRGEDLEIGHYHIIDPVEVTGPYCPFDVEKQLNLGFPRRAEVIHPSGHASEPPWRRAMAAKTGKKGSPKSGPKGRNAARGPSTAECAYGGNGGGAAGLGTQVSGCVATGPLSPPAPGSPVMAYYATPTSFTDVYGRAPDPTSEAFVNNNGQRKSKRGAGDPSHGNPNYQVETANNPYHSSSGWETQPSSMKSPKTQPRKLGTGFVTPAGKLKFGHE